MLLLISRRISKDIISINQPVVIFADSDVGKNAINALKNVLGEVRKAEEKMDGRQFFKRRTENVAPENPVLKKNLESLIKDWKKSSKERKR